MSPVSIAVVADSQHSVGVGEGAALFRVPLTEAVVT
jgi:hypothetical protein